ncbi:hypothetical protein SAMN04489810_1021 [Microbacterium pygmaeum]|uniref:Protein-tyrosine-phosphatase-like N-terminal domain-containing protein n=2 Tax=Microbacterium pygmaeum TaxID=370764 RepID=A0A1G7WBW7_9MICO|nr:hypothetical protein SAMN04489810_1021 [Microbacterium pygmaeum]
MRDRRVGSVAWKPASPPQELHMPHDLADDANTIQEIVDRLCAKFPQHSVDTVRAVVTESYDELNEAHVRDFVAVLVEKQAKKRLKHLEP